MSAFRPISLNDRERFRKLAFAEGNGIAEQSFTSYFLWNVRDNIEIAEVGDRYAIRYRTKEAYGYTYPLGSGELRPAIEYQLADAEQNGVEFSLRCVPKHKVDEIEAAFPGAFEAKPETSSFEYVYEAASLAEPSGRKMHTKKNHINRFIAENPGWSFEALGESNLEECHALANEWVRENGDKIAATPLREDLALERLFADFDALGMEGGVLRDSERVVAFSAGILLREDMFVTHFEKAYADVNGAFAMLNREEARRILAAHPQVRYINREEDMGLAYLRKAKESYYPAFMMEKYKLTRRK